MDSDGDNVTTGDDSGKRKRENGPNSVDKHAAAKAKFDQTADQLSTLLAKEARRRSTDTDSSDTAAYKKTIAELERKIKNLKAEIYDAKEALLESRRSGGSGSCRTCASSATASEELKRKLKSARTALDREQKLHEETKKELAGRMDSLSELMVENGGLKVDLDTLQSEHAILKAEHAEVKQQQEAMFSVSPQQYNQLAQEKDAAVKASQEAQAALNRVLAEKANAVDAFDKLKEMNTSIMSSTRTYKTDAAAMAKQIAKLTSQLAQQTAEHEAELKTTREVLTESVEGTKTAAMEAQRNLKALVGSLETDLALERKKVAAFTKDAKTYNSNTSPGAVSVDQRDDFSVLSDGTYPANGTNPAFERTVLRAPPSHQQQHQQSSVPRDRPQGKATCLLIDGVNPDTPPHHIQTLAEKYGPLVAFASMGYNRYLVEFKDHEDASLALYHIPGRVVDGAKLNCKVYHEPSSNPAFNTVTNDSAASIDTQYFPVPYTTTTTMNTATFVLDKTSSVAVDKPHLRCVYILHQAPPKHRLSESETEWELSRYGAVKHIKPVSDSMAYLVEFYEKSSADNALNNFPPHINRYQISCKCHFNQLPKTFVPVPISDDDRSQEYTDTSVNMKRAPQRVILHDPLLSENRTVRRVDNLTGPRTKGPYCSYCDEEGRVNVMYTHNDERCFYKRNMNQGSNGRNTNNNNRSNGRSQVNMGYDKKRGRSESPERPVRKSSNSARERDASADGRSTGSGGGSGSGVKSSKPVNNDTFDPVTGVRPLSTSR